MSLNIKTDQTSNPKRLGALVFFAIVALAGTCSLEAAEKRAASIGGPFSLTNHLNSPVTEDDFLGKYMLVYFGYTYCPDVCPTDLQIMTIALRMLDSNVSGQITPVFVSVDPERDTVDVMAAYIKYFHEDLIGLTGTVEQVKAVKSEYRVYSAKSGDAAEYLVDHTAYTYLMGKNGELLKHFDHAVEPKAMAAQISALVK